MLVFPGSTSDRQAAQLAERHTHWFLRNFYFHLVDHSKKPPHWLVIHWKIIPVNSKQGAGNSMDRTLTGLNIVGYSFQDLHIVAELLDLLTAHIRSICLKI